MVGGILNDVHNRSMGYRNWKHIYGQLHTQHEYFTVLQIAIPTDKTSSLSFKPAWGIPRAKLYNLCQPVERD